MERRDGASHETTWEGLKFAGGAGRTNPQFTLKCVKKCQSHSGSRGESGGIPRSGKEANGKGPSTCVKLSCVRSKIGNYVNHNLPHSRTDKKLGAAKGSAVAGVLCGRAKGKQTEREGFWENGGC